MKLPLLVIISAILFGVGLSSPTSQLELNSIAKSRGKLYFGTATDNPEFNDTAYQAILHDNRMFGQLTAENSMKWYATEPSPGNFTFGQADAIADLAKKNGQLLRGHNCVWHNQLPDWVANGTFTRPELLSVVERHCGTLVGHYKGHVWDVINECLNDDGTFREDVFFNVTGTEYIRTALRAARAADPHAKLYINDYNIEGPGPKSTALQNLVKSLKADGVPIDGVGLQNHLTSGQLPSNIQENMEAFTSLGVEVAITELDIRINLPPTATELEQQRKDFQTVISACEAVRGCVGVTVWDWTDKYSWITNGDPCPWDANLQKKPAFYGIAEGFGGEL